ncbi:MAG: lysozyme [Carnobacterium sp.]|uniref:lysozyme n=1 Tax=Carnobacterium sp. TaxID=48221 RepID=UPI0033164364
MANENMRISQTGRNLIQEFEGLKLQAYQDQVGVWTIGYGHTKGVKAGMSITQAQANAYLDDDITDHAAGIFTYVTVQLNQNQFDALVSFHFNLGAHILKGSTLLTYINNKQWKEAAAKMKEYINADGKPSDGLIRRRKAETDLFLKAAESDDSGRSKKFKTGDKVRLSATAKQWKGSTGFDLGSFKSTYVVDWLNADGTIYIKPVGADWGGNVLESDIEFVRNNDIQKDEIIKLRDQATNWVGGAEITSGMKGIEYSVRYRTDGNRLYIDNGKFRGLVYDWDAVKV